MMNKSGPGENKEVALPLTAKSAASHTLAKILCSPTKEDRLRLRLNNLVLPHSMANLWRIKRSRNSMDGLLCMISGILLVRRQIELLWTVQSLVAQQ